MSMTNVAAQRGEIQIAKGSMSAAGARIGGLNDLIVSELNGRYYESAYNNRMFVAHAAAVATSVVGTGMIGLQLWNGSPVTGVNLVLHKVAGNVVVTSASATGVVLAFGTGQTAAPTGQTAISKTTNCFLGGPASIATALNAGTFSNAPVAIWDLMHNTAAIATTGEDQGFQMDFEGSIIVPPQSYICIATVGAAAAASGMNLSLMWSEIPV